MSNDPTTPEANQNLKDMIHSIHCKQPSTPRHEDETPTYTPVPRVETTPSTTGATWSIRRPSDVRDLP